MLLQALVVVGESARGQHHELGLVLHQIAERVDGVHAVHLARLVVAELERAVIQADVGACVAQLLLQGQHVAHVGRAVLPPVERVHLARRRTARVVVDEPVELAAALVHKPLYVVGRRVD